jgi:hypothetical protein
MNSKFGGAEWKGQNNVFTTLQKNLAHGLIGVGCAGHIIHSTVRAASNILPVDVEMICLQNIFVLQILHSQN